eukprot:c23336_g1_i1.p1 GENE.c23336_g1_i1~~c23336_g1_i1.p1  ORF type:complete len:302 (+),score=76.10 c23336_g1_i1:33-908(+)
MAFTGLPEYDGDHFTSSQFGGMGATGPGGNTFNSDIASQSPQKKFHDSRVESIIPVTVRQILTCEKSQDDTFHIDGTDVQQVTLVVLITTITPQETKVTYTADDGTGMISIVKWIPTDTPENQKQDHRLRFRENTYVRVFGALRSSENNVNVLAYNMRAVEDFNEITYHFLEAISVHKYHTKSKLGGSSGILAMPGASSSGGYGGHSGHGTSSSRDHPMHQASADGFTPIQRDLLSMISQSNNSEGVAVVDMIHAYPAYSQNDIRETAKYLEVEGHIFATVDEHHFKSTAS